MLRLVKVAMRSGCFRDELDVHTVPVQVVTGGGGVPMKSEWFENFAAASASYPELDIYNSSARFTWSMKGVHPDGRVGLRFETVAAYRDLSV